MYKIGIPIKVAYQSLNAKTGVVATMSVYDPSGAVVPAMGGVMVEVGTTGRYTKEFTPDAEGTWMVQVNDNKNGKQMTTYKVDVIDLSDIQNPPVLS